MRYIYHILLMISLGTSLYSQTDNEFWFVAPDITSGHSTGGKPIFLRLSAVNFPVTVSVSQPANPSWKPIKVNIDAGKTESIELTDSVDLVENFPDNTINNKGLLIQSSGGDITAYYEITAPNNPDIWALKGKNALGYNFIVPMQNKWQNGNFGGGWNYSPVPYNEIHIVATEDNTIVQIIPSNDLLGGHAAGLPFNVTLNKGQTFNCRAADYLGNNHIGGTIINVISGGKVAITISDDSIQKERTAGTCYDVNGDQTIPITRIGREYLVMKGKVEFGESAFIMATVNNSKIYINGVLDTILNMGQIYGYELTTNFTNINSDQDIYVYHLTGVGCEQGGAVLPTIEGCTGSNEVSFVRSSTRELYLNLMVQPGGQYNFKIYYEDGTSFTIPDTWFEEDTISGWWILKDANKQFANNTGGGVPVDEVTKIVNETERFHIGILNGNGSGGCNYGYFSDFAENRGSAQVVETGSTIIQACHGDTISLNASGGKGYIWSPDKHIDNPYIANPQITPPSGLHSYTVTIQRSCWPDTTITVQVFVTNELIARFSLQSSSGCAPFEPWITNSSIGVTDEYRWDFDGDNFWDTITTNDLGVFTPGVINNINSSDTSFGIRLQVQNLEGCVDELYRQITIFPEINAAFEVSDSIGCEPLPVQFTNLSSGNFVDSLFQWEFGDNGSSELKDPSHEYRNIGGDDSIYTVRLIARSPYQCYDTVYQDIVVHPFMQAGFSIDTVKSCAPFYVTLYNNSIGTDTFEFIFFDVTTSTIDTSFTSTVFNTFKYLYKNTDVVPHLKKIQQIVKNKEGCSDTLIRLLDVYPTVIANISYGPVSGCDSTRVSFDASTSLGFNLTYRWEFGDGTSSNIIKPEHTYYNKTNSTIVNQVNLIIQSDKRCVDTQQVPVIIYPFIDANFAIDSVIGCHPFDVVISNHCIGVDSLYQWSFGDGETSTLNSASLTHKYTNNSYANDSTYKLRLIGMNKWGCKDTMEREILVYHNISATFTSNKDTACYPPKFTFTASKPNGATFYLWNFDDGATSTQVDNSYHEYPKNNTNAIIDYQVSLFVIDTSNNLCTASFSKTIKVNPYVKAEFPVEKFIDCSPSYHSFKNSSYGNANSYFWYVNNVLKAVTTNYADTFKNTSLTNKNFEIKLVAQTPQGCKSTFKDNIEIYPKVTAGFTMSKTADCNPLTINFTNSSSGNDHYYWSFGDQATSNLVNPSHTYFNYEHVPKNFNVKLIVSNSAGCSDSVSKTVTAYPRPYPNFEIDSASGCSPFMVRVDSVHIEPNTTYFWDMNDGTTFNTTVIPPYEYINLTDDIHYYTIKMVADKGNCKDSVLRKVAVYPKVIADFTPDTAGCAPLVVTFKNNTVHANAYYWDFNNTDFDYTENPTITFYNDEGTYLDYKVKLLALSSYGCNDTVIKNVRVYPTPNANFSIYPQKYSIYPETEILIQNLTTQGDFIYSWDFGDGYTTDTNNPVRHTYETWGIYDIKVKVESNECTDEITKQFEVKAPFPIANFRSLPDSGCVPHTVLFENRSIYGATYHWDFGTGDTSSQQSPEYQYTEPGVYNVKLTVYGYGEGDDYISVEEENIKVFRLPEIAFSIYPDTIELPDDYIYTVNESKYAVSFLWEFGNGDTSSQRTPTHLYAYIDQNLYTNFTIKLTGWTKEGCVASDSIPNAVFSKGKGAIEYPNVFTPSLSGSSGGNTEGLNILDNTIFRPFSDGVIEYHLEIYNRWGELIFTSDNISIGWDGYYKGKIARQGTYVWSVSGRFSNGQPFRERGDVTLIIRW